MTDNMGYADVATPTPGKEWLEKSNDERLELIKKALASNNTVEPISAQENGQIILKFNDPLGPEKRGTVLLDIEEDLKKSVDQGLYVLLETLGDKNSLRNLRGIEVKS